MVRLNNFGRGGARRGTRVSLASVAPVLGAMVVTSCLTAQANAAEGDVVVRKSVTTLTAEEKSDFVEAIHRLKTTPSPEGDEVGNWYDHFVAAHLRKLVCYTDEPGQGGYGHNGPDLLTWHREYMREFELAMSTVMGKPMAIPYWDWTDPESLDVVFADDFMGPTGDADDGYYVKSGPFKYGDFRINVKGFESTNPGQADWIVRATGMMQGMDTLPTIGEIQQALLRPVYDAAPWGVESDLDTSFRAFVDGAIGATGTTCDGGAISVLGATSSLLHGTVHMWVGGMDQDGNPGTLTDTVTSPNDPIFWLHHTAIDRIAESWWATHDYQFLPVSGGPRGSNLGDKMWPYDLTNGDMAVPVDQLGYVYDSLIVPEEGVEFVAAEDWIVQRGTEGHSH